MARFAIVIGIANYDHFRNLSKAAIDAAAIGQLLREHGKYQVQPLPGRLGDAGDRWELAPDKKLPGKELSQALETFFLDQAAGQEALIYFAGHGFELPGLGRKKKGYLATSDCTNDGRNGILFNDLNDLIRDSNFSNLVMMLDCCHAGSFLERSLLESSLTAFQEKQDYYLITACRAFERAREGEEHGIFTAAVLKGLQADQADSQGAVTGDRLFDFIQRELRHSGQEPIRMGMGRSIPLVNYQPQVKQVAAIVNATGEIVCPYQGLQAFTAAQRDFFFGRKRIVEAIKQRIDRTPVVPVIGPSGSGKSSVVRAGLIPWLAESGWRILNPIKPGFEPLTELRGVLKPWFERKQQQQLKAWVEDREQYPQGLINLADHLPGTESFLLVVDQFEEVFTVCTNTAEQQRFIELLTQVAECAHPRLAVVMTMRADFLEPCLRYTALHHLIQTQAVFMPPLTGVDLREVITEPAKRQGYTVEEALLLQVLEDVGKEPGFLPLLEFVLTQLWEKRDRVRQLLTLEQYEALGGLTGALNLHAERVYHYRDYSVELASKPRDPQAQDWIRRICLKLVRTGADTKDTRQRQPRQTLLEMQSDERTQQLIATILDELVDARLLVTGGAEQPWIDLAHEALMEGWKQLAHWRQDDRDLRRLVDRLEDAQREWEHQARHPDFLLPKGLLAQAKAQEANLEPYFTASLQEFYTLSKAQEQQQAEALHWAKSEAALTARAAEVVNLFNTRPVEGLLQTLKIVGLSLQELGEPIGAVQDCLRRAMENCYEQNCLSGHRGPVYSVVCSPDGTLLASGGEDGTIKLWDLQGNRIREFLNGYGNPVAALAFSPDGQRLLSSADRILRLCDLQGNLIGAVFQGHWDAINSVAFSPDGQTIVSGSRDHTVRLWDLQGRPVGQPFRGHTGSVLSVRFSPNGQIIASSSVDGTLRMWNLLGKSIGQPFQGHEGAIRCVSFSPDGQLLASGGDDQTIRLWNLQGQPVRKLFQGHEDNINWIAFSPNGEAIISCSSDRTIRLWNLKGQPIGQPLRGHEDSVWSAIAISEPNSRLSPGQTIISCSSDCTVRLWDVMDNLIGKPFRGHSEEITSIAFSPDGKYIASGSANRTVRLCRGGTWEDWLKICCDRLRHHPVLKHPTTEVEKAACEVCRKYGWVDCEI